MGFKEDMSKRLIDIFAAPSAAQRNRKGCPDWPGAIEWESHTGNYENTVKGWAWKDGNSLGTVFICHSYTCHCMMDFLVDIAFHLREKHHLAVVSVDLRSHGKSGNRPISLGGGEMWDVQAALDWADQNNFPRPYALYGESLGALAAQRVVQSDSRVIAAFLKSSTGSPWKSILNLPHLPPILASAGNAINLAYGWDILSFGDIRNHTANPDHRPLICYATGDRDEYDPRHVHEIYDYWYEGQHGAECWPHDARHCLKWWVNVPGVGHEWQKDQVPWFYELLDSFVDTVKSKL
jgi:pimeloyl-ACP methyl ester carboxylesterase